MGQASNLRRAAVLLVVAAMLAAACDVVGTEVADQTTTTTAPPVTIVSDPPADAHDVAPDHVLTITVTDGTIAAVAITPNGPVDSEGSDLSDVDPIRGTRSVDETSWTSTTSLVPSTSYTVASVVVDRVGERSERRWSFSTGAPLAVFRAILSPGDDKVVGVGMPVIIQLSAPVPPAGRADFVSRLEVTSVPAVVGAWHWFSGTDLHWRPKDYWPAGTAVEVDAAIAGYTPGDGSFAVKDVNVKYSIGDAHVSTVDVDTHTMTVTDNGLVVRSIPVSTGRDAFPTRSGIHVASEKANPKVMDSSTVGIPRNASGGYYQTVPHSVRISNSGEFVHAASWSTGSQGNSNVSHGCVNISPADAQWFYDFTQIGDVIDVVGSPAVLEPTNGIGDWQVPWAEWAN